MKTWADYRFPAWVPESVREETRRFWADEYQRGPGAWLENVRGPYNYQPELGAFVQCESMAQTGRPLMRGFWVPVWNNIGRVIQPGGIVGYSSTCRIQIIARRLQRLRVPGWRKPEGAVIVDRTSILGNPWPVAEVGLDASKQNYIEWMNGSDKWPELNERRERVIARIPQLAGKDVVCFCALDSDWCHGMELIVRANPLAAAQDVPASADGMAGATAMKSVAGSTTSNDVPACDDVVTATATE